MSSHRVEAGFEHLREAFARVLSQVVEFPVGAFVTVLSAKVTANTAHARITLSVMPVAQENAVLEALRRYDHDIKDALVHEIRLRRVPRLHYVFDRTEEDASHLESLINQAIDEDQNV